MGSPRQKTRDISFAMFFGTFTRSEKTKVKKNDIQIAQQWSSLLASAAAVEMPHPDPVWSEAGTKRGIKVPEFCKLYGVSRTFAYGLMKAGVLRRYKAGRSTRIDSEDAARWWKSCAQGGR